MPYVSHRWLGGMLTNFKTIKQSIKRLEELEELTSESAGEGLTKKELLGLTREQAKLERSLGGIKDMNSLPDAIFVIDVEHEKIAVKEARKLGIPVVAIVDTNCSPDGIDYLVPGNDDAMKAAQLYTIAVADAVLEGKASVPAVPEGQDEFVELDEQGKPKDQKRSGRAKPATRKKRATRKAKSGDETPADAEVEAVESEHEAEPDNAAGVGDAETPVAEAAEPAEAAADEAAEPAAADESQDEAEVPEDSADEDKKD